MIKIEERKEVERTQGRWMRGQIMELETSRSSIRLPCITMIVHAVCVCIYKHSVSHTTSVLSYT